MIKAKQLWLQRVKVSFSLMNSLSIQLMWKLPKNGTSLLILLVYHPVFVVPFQDLVTLYLTRRGQKEMKKHPPLCKGTTKKSCVSLPFMSCCSELSCMSILSCKGVWKLWPLAGWSCPQVGPPSSVTKGRSREWTWGDNSSRCLWLRASLRSMFWPWVQLGDF